MLNKMIGEKFYCGLDIGSQRIKTGILKVKDAQNIELIGVYENKTHGYKDASVSDLGELSECIHNTMNELAKKTGIRIKEAQLGVSGELVAMRETHAVIPLADKSSKVIGSRDIKKVNNQARLLGLKMEEEILHELPQYYSVDDVNSALNPFGLYGRKLGVHSLMIIANANRMRNITKAVNQAGYDVGNHFFSSYVSSEIALSEQDKDEGCALIDIGAKVTSVLIFKEKVLKYLEKIDLGGEQFTRSIARQLNLPLELAEEIKKNYAVALSTDRYNEEEILVKRENAYVPIKREIIYQSIEPEISHLVESIRTVLMDSDLHDRINGGITLIGGGSLLPGLIERIGGENKASVKLGTINKASQKNLPNAALFSSVVGLAQKGFQKSLGYTMSSNGHTHWTKHVVNRVRELYQEYF